MVREACCFADTARVALVPIVLTWPGEISEGREGGDLIIPSGSREHVDLVGALRAIQNDPNAFSYSL